MKHTKTKTTEIEYRTCDTCHKRGDVIGECSGCGADVCEDCRHQLEDDPWSGDYCGDYWHVACDRCSELLKPLGEKASAIRDAANDEIEKLRDEWLDECKEARQ